MHEVPVLLFVVACSPDLLSCQQVLRGHHVFDDMPACLAARHEVLAAPATLPGAVILAKCRYDPGVARGRAAHRPPVAIVN